MSFTGQIKKAVAEKIWRLVGELKQTADGSLILRIGLRSGGSAATLWKKFQMAYSQRKLQITFDDQGMNLIISRGNRMPWESDEEPTF